MTTKFKKAAVIATGWMGDTIACSAAAASLAEQGYDTTLFIRWPQLRPLLETNQPFRTRLYWRVNLLKWFKPLIDWYFDVVVWEPPKWTYTEPFTSEIRRLAKCEPHPEYALHLPNKYESESYTLKSPTITISRDIYKRAYERDITKLVSQLETFVRIDWVGLDASQNSKHGKRQSLLKDAQYILQSDVFLGPEGGMLWLAAGLGKPCIYLTEHIHEVERVNQTASLDSVLGAKNYFPTRHDLIALPSGCSNVYIVQTIQQFLNIHQ